MCLSIFSHELLYSSAMIGCGIFSSTILGSEFGGGVLLPPSCVSVRPPFLHQSPSKNEVPPVLIHPKKAPNTGFFLSIVLVNNPLISPRFWNSMVDRYAIGNFRIYVLITPMKRSPCFHNYSAAGTDAKYESAQTILSVLAHGITSSFSTFVP